MNKKFLQIIIGLITLIIALVWFVYGTINPCEMLKKEVASQAKTGEAQFGYMLFGGFINRAIDTLSPVQCIEAIIKIRTGSNVDEVMKEFGK